MLLRGCQDSCGKSSCVISSIICPDQIPSPEAYLHGDDVSASLSSSCLPDAWYLPAKLVQALAGSYRAASWPEDRLEITTAGRRRDQLDSSSRQAKNERPMQMLAWRKRLPSIIAAFEKSMQDLLSDVVQLLVDKVASLLK